MQMQDEPINLSHLSLQSLAFLRSYGRVGMILSVTLLSVYASLLLTLFFVYFIYPQWLPDLPEIVIAAVFVPVLIAPPVTAVFTALLFELDKAHSHVVTMSHTDSLTGCLNRRGFFEQAEKHLHTFTNANSCLVGMIDMDNFKVINDNYGHGVGDEVLLKLSNLLKSIVDNDGIVGRLGGDEYAIVAFGNRDEMHTLQREIQEAIGDFSFAEHKSASASFGGVLLAPAETIGDALIRADEILYVVKGERKSSLRRTA